MLSLLATVATFTTLLGTDLATSSGLTHAVSILPAETRYNERWIIPARPPVSRVHHQKAWATEAQRLRGETRSGKCSIFDVRYPPLV
jgi:hypothetical protein